jgi:hypothetical protein
MDASPSAIALIVQSPLADDFQCNCQRLQLAGTCGLIRKGFHRRPPPPAAAACAERRPIPASLDQLQALSIHARPRPKCGREACLDCARHEPCVPDGPLHGGHARLVQSAHQRRTKSSAPFAGKDGVRHDSDHQTYASLRRNSCCSVARSRHDFLDDRADVGFNRPVIDETGPQREVPADGCVG